MERCKNCKWWGGTSDEPGDLGTCTKADDTKAWHEMIDSSQSYASAFCAESLVTGPEFGCVQFEAKASGVEG